MNYSLFILEKEFNLLKSTLESWSITSRKDYSEIYKTHIRKLNDLEKTIQHLRNPGKDMKLFELGYESGYMNGLNHDPKVDFDEYNTRHK